MFALQVGGLMAPVIEKQRAQLVGRVIVVDDEPALAELICDVASQRFQAEVIKVSTLREARRAMKDSAVSLLVTDIHLPDGDGTSLLPLLHKSHPSAEAIVITGDPSLDGAIEAMRQGATDFLPKPFDAETLTKRLALAMQRHVDLRHRNRRLKTLREAVKRLNEARKMVTKKVDLLCNDLVSAYSELSRQMDIVRLQEGYAKFLGGTNDLEHLLCHTMDWLMRQLGYANVGIWLASDDQQFSLGAYMKYTIAGDASLTEAIEKNLLRMAVRKGFVHISGPEVKELLTPAELKHLGEQDILAVNCTYLGDTLGAIVMFRDARTPFTEDDIQALRTVSPLFSANLTRAVKASEQGEELDEPTDPQDNELDDSKQPPKQQRKPKKDPADWWKRGENPPF